MTVKLCSILAFAAFFNLAAYDVVFDSTNGAEAVALETFSAPYDANAKQMPVDTRYGVSFNDYTVSIEIELAEPHDSDTLEIFLKTANDSSETRYYQVYGSPSKKDFAMYYYGQRNARYFPLEKDEYTISSDTVKNAKGETVSRVRIAIVWSAFRRSLPFVKGDAAPWLFNIVRWRDGAGYALKGKLHAPSTWAALKMPEFTQENMDSIYNAVTRKLEMRKPVFDSELYERTSFDAYKPASVQRSSMSHAGRFINLSSALTLREDLGASSYSLKNGFHSAQFVFSEIPRDGKLYLVNASTLKEKFNYTLTLDDIEIKKGSISDFPFNLDLSKYNVKSGSVLELTTDSPEKSRRLVSFGIVSMKHGIEPAKAFDVRYPAPAEAAPKRDLAGVCETNYLSRHLSQQREILRKNARVVFIGDSITDGFHGAAWDRLDKKFNCGNMGISGDWTQNVLWRIAPENGSVLGTVRPAVCVLMIGTNNNAYTPEETAQGIQAIINELKRQLPATKIILHSILPRNAVFEKGNRYERINEIISSFADGRSVFHIDMGALFMDEARNVNKTLLPDLLHPGAKGYEIWAGCVTPAIEKLMEKPE